MAINIKDPAKSTADINVLGLTTAPPSSGLTTGDSYLVVATAGGMFTGHEDSIAVYSPKDANLPWDFIAPVYGDVLYDSSNSAYFVWGGSSWDATADFDKLTTSTEAPSSHMMALVTHSTPLVPVVQAEASPMSCFHVMTMDAAGGEYALFANHDLAVVDCIVVQAAAAGGAGCFVTVEDGGGQLVFDAMAVDAVNPAIVRASTSKVGLFPILAGTEIIVKAIDNGAVQFPVTSIILTVVKV